MRRLLATVGILGAGIPLMLWSLDNALTTLSKYGIVKVKPLTIQINPEIIAGAVSLMLLATTTTIMTVAVIRSRRLLGIIPVKELRRHALILGPTGSGKTTIAKRVVEMAAKRNVRVTIIDWKGEYVNYIKGATIVRKINVWDVGGRSPAERAVIAVELLREVTRDVADISSASATLLLKELVKLYERGTPTTKDVVEKLERYMQNALLERRLAEANMAAALLRRLYWLLVDEERPDENVHGNPAVTVYDLSSVGSSYLKTMYSLTVLTKKYYEALRRGPTDELSEIIIAEECQNYVRGRRPDEPPSIGERIINELRSFGVGVVLIAPDPVQIPWHIARDIGALIAIGNQALPDFLEQMRYRYGRRGLQVIGETDSTFVYHRSKLAAVRFKPRPQKPITLKASSPKIVEEEPKVAEGQTFEQKVIEVEELTAKPKVIEVEELESATESKIVEEQAPKGPPTPPPGS
jgi:GTPase SAR1 family protein